MGPETGSDYNGFYNYVGDQPDRALFKFYRDLDPVLNTPDGLAFRTNDIIENTGFWQIQKNILPVLDRLVSNDPSQSGQLGVTALRDNLRGYVSGLNDLANAKSGQLVFAGLGAPFAIASGGVGITALAGGGLGILGTTGSIVSIDYAQANARGLLTGSFEMQSTAGGNVISRMTGGQYAEGAYALGALGLGGIGFARAGYGALSDLQYMRRQNVAISFYRDSGFSEAAILDHIGGIDFARGVSVVNLPKWSELVQYQLPSATIPGNYFARPGTPGSVLGFYTGGTQANIYVANGNITALRTTAAPITDTWSLRQIGWKVETQGGGTQYFTTDKNWIKK